MRLTDLFSFAFGSLASNWRRTGLIALATAIGVSSVLLLTALGEGASRYVLGQFESLGSNLLIVLPGRSETVGGPPPLLGETPRDLTIDDAYALLAQPGLKRVAPVMVGAAPVSTPAGLEREVNVFGTTADLLHVQRLEMDKGSFLPTGDPKRGLSVCVLGFELANELFPGQVAIGRWLRVGDRRFRVVGSLANSGVTVGVDFNDIAIIPVASAQALFNRESLFRILVEAETERDLDNGALAIHRMIAARHEGEDDVTVIAQDSVVKTLARILMTLTVGVSGMSAISLAVAGVLIMNVMLVSVTQRRAEIGLMKAIGARSIDVRRLFIVEALMLALVGAAVGLAVGLAATATVAQLYPSFPVAVPSWSIIVVLLVSILSGIVFGVLPARRAAALDPIDALSKR
ncbi:MAG: putative ABC transport system permease protein [Gammaproteobacteria bacterium]|jgi:putative ABC transport system permease protein